MRKVIFTLLVMLGLAVSASAQDRTITGRVTDEKGSPLQGVSVTSSDGKGAQTDRNGDYSLVVGNNARSLIFSSVNFETLSRAITASGSVNISMAATAGKLDEVVIVGYGVQQKRAFTGSSSKIDAKPIAQLVTPSFDKQLAGRAAGVNVVNASGQVNAPARIRIRGLNSLNQNLSPLIVVDGTPISTGNLGLVSNTNQLGDVNPEDIERIDVLKDGASTAIYGSRAAAGVILITTKKGTRGRLNVAYNGTYGYSRPMNTFELLNAQEFTTIANEKFINAGQLPPARFNGTNTDWQENIFVRNAVSTTHTISVSGGTDKTLYYMSMNYADNRGIVRTNRSTQYRIRMNVEAQATKFLKISNNLGVSRVNDFDQNNGSNALSGSIVGAIRALPNVPIYSTTHPTGYNIAPTANALGAGPNLRTIDDNYTNIAFVLDKNRNQSDQYRIIDNAAIDLNLFKGLRLHSQIGLDYYTDNSSQILDPRHGDGASSQGIIQQGQQNILNTNIQNFLNYNLTVSGKHNIFLTLGQELQQTRRRVYQAQGSTISDLFFLKENIITNTAVTQQVFGSYDETAFTSLFGRLNYDYKNKYFIQGSIRRDGQSSLAPDRRFGTFPGVSVGWRPSEEGFWKGTPFLNKNINELKIRASYAEVGNRIPGYPYLSTYGSRPYGNVSGIAAATVGNPSLQWETSKKLDIGVDITFLNSRLTLTADYYKNDLDDLILDVPTPYSTGVPLNLISQNVGTAENKGYELTLDASILQGRNFKWSMNTNWSYVENKIKSLYQSGGVDIIEIPVGNYNINRVGSPSNVLYGYQFAGVNSGNGNPVYYNAANQLVQRQVSNGVYYFANSLSDPALGAQTTLSVADKRILGNVIPRYFGGITNTFSYKGFSLDVLFRYQGGNKIMNITRQEILLNQKFANGGRELLNRWTTPGQITDVPKLYYNSDAIINQNLEATTRFVESGAFFRIQNIGLAYDLDAIKLQNRTNGVIRNARVFIQAQNVQAWSKYRGIDPEAFSEFGQDNSVSPQVRSITAGVSIGL